MEEAGVLAEIGAQAERYLLIKRNIETLEAQGKEIRALIKTNVAGMLTCPGSMEIEGITITIVKGRESERFTRESLVRAGVLPEQIEKAAVRSVGESSLRITRGKGE